MDLASIEKALEAQGLLLRGGFAPGPDDALPALPDGRAARSLLLVGNAGPDLWPHFSRAPEAMDGQRDPLNRWTERVLGDLAAELGGLALYPFGGPPYHPFVAWAKRCEPVAESPLGILIHPIFGLWHAYRGALLLAEALPLAPPAAVARPCDTCAEQPCLSACPVGAFGPEGYAVADCAGHVGSAAGADCLNEGCRARRACPVGAPGSGYAPGQAEFHMAAFLAARQEDAKP